MARQRLGEKKVQKLRGLLGLPIVGAFARGGTEHRLDLCLEDGRILHLYPDGSIEEATFRHGITTKLPPPLTTR